MEKTISTRQWAAIKRTAQNVQPLVQQKVKVQMKIASLVEDFKTLNAEIQGFEQGIKALCGGLGTEQLIVRQVTTLEGKFDKDGKPIKKVSYVPSALVTYNEEQNNYTISIPDENTEAQPSVQQSTEEPTNEASAEQETSVEEE